MQIEQAEAGAAKSKCRFSRPTWAGQGGVCAHRVPSFGVLLLGFRYGGSRVECKVSSDYRYIIIILIIIVVIIVIIIIIIIIMIITILIIYSLTHLFNLRAYAMPPTHRSGFEQVRGGRSWYEQAEARHVEGG